MVCLLLLGCIFGYITVYFVDCCLVCLVYFGSWFDSSFKGIGLLVSVRGFDY